MAEIGLLDIQKVPNNLAADVEVLYAVTYDESDVSTNRSYNELVELFGVDDGPLNTRDEPIRFGRGRLPFHRCQALPARLLAAQDRRDRPQRALPGRVELGDERVGAPGDRLGRAQARRAHPARVHRRPHRGQPDPSS